MPDENKAESLNTIDQAISQVLGTLPEIMDYRGAERKRRDREDRLWNALEALRSQIGAIPGAKDRIARLHLQEQEAKTRLEATNVKVAQAEEKAQALVDGAKEHAAQIRDEAMNTARRELAGLVDEIAKRKGELSSVVDKLERARAMLVSGS